MPILNKCVWVVSLILIVMATSGVANAAQLPALSPMNNGSIALVSSKVSEKEFSVGLISQGGGNANNVSVRLTLRDGNDQMVAEKIFPNTDILHESAKTFALSLPTTLPAGQYSPEAVVYNSDQLVNKAFIDLPVIKIGITEEENIPPEETTPVEIISGNGNLELVSTLLNGQTLTVSIVSRPENTNNAGVTLTLKDPSGVIKANKTFPHTDILHESARDFNWSLPANLPAGQYRITVQVEDGRRQKLAEFKSALLLGAGEPSEEEAGNPFVGKKFYLSAYNDAKTQAEAWRSTRPADAAELDKIATVPTARWMGDWNQDIGGDVAREMSAARSSGSLPVFVIYNIPNRDCGGYSAGGSNHPDGYRAWMQNFARGLGGNQAVVVLEPDALSLTDCLSEADKATRFSLIREAVGTLATAGATVYLDAGHPNWVPAFEMASRLKQAGIGQARGFALNVSNFYRTEENIRYGEEISRSAGNKPFVIDTSRNGQGSSGEWCNPAGRGLGTPSTAVTGHSLVDAFFWFKPPGQSDGTCNGAPSAGVWWADYALGLARRAAN